MRAPRKNKVFLTAGEARAIDAELRERFGISTLVLMENAGRAIAAEVLRAIKPAGTVAVVCGKGNNGGDGFVCARHLLAAGIKTNVFLAGKQADVQNEARVNLDILRALGIKITEVSEGNLFIFKKRILRYNLIVDALLGVGLKGEVKALFRDVIEIINSSAAYKIAVDIPSGLDAATGKILGACVKADRTVTFIAGKRGMVLGAGPEVSGEIIVDNLGVPFSI